MAYRLKRRRPLATELHRILEHQLQLAIADLPEAGSPRANERIHQARRRVKKTRALLRLFARALGQEGRNANRRLRTISRMLAPIANGESIFDTVN